MVILPTVFMSKRPMDALGQQQADALQREAEENGYVEIRRAALYCARASSGFRRPRDVISLKQARSYLLLANEAADDALVGYAKHSFDIGVRWDHLFQAVLVLRQSY